MAWHEAIRSRVISLNVLRLMESQFMFYCDHITSFYACFNRELEETPRKSEQFKTEDEFIRRIKFLHSIDLKLTRFLLLVRNYFKWMLLLIISTDIIIIVIDIYWIYGGFIYGDNPFFLRKPGKHFDELINTHIYLSIYPIESSLTPFGKVLAMLLVFNSSGNLQNEKEKSTGFIYLLDVKSVSYAESKRLFLLQKIHTVPYQFDGNNFFNVNYKTLIAVRMTF